MSRDEIYMQEALEMARWAYQIGEVPVGAVIVHEDIIIARAHNEKELRHDATAHAEMLALQQAQKYLGSWRLSEAIMYVTLEPCPMCAGAMVNTRLDTLVFAAYDDKAGAAGSITDIVRMPWLNHQVKVRTGVMERDAVALLEQFFEELRRDGRAGRRRSTRNRVGGE